MGWERRWYRYHHLFAELLRQRLRQSITAATDGAEIPLKTMLHLRASIWYEAQGLDLEAFQQAAAANDVERAARLMMEGKQIPMHHRGAMTAILDWLASCPGCPTCAVGEICLGVTRDRPNDRSRGDAAGG